MDNFYAIGGSFRSIAKINMARKNYPLKILHHYTIGAHELSELLHMLVNMSPEEISHLSGASGKRAPALIPASLILEHLIEHAHVQNIIFSASGIREGFMYEKLSPYVQMDDPLISSAADHATQAGRVAGYGREMFDWMRPIIGKETFEEERLRLAACILSEIAWRMHPDYRAEWIYQRIVGSSLIGVNHTERVFLAAMLYHRHQYKFKDVGPTEKLLPDTLKLKARVIGTAMNLACHLSGSVTGNLSKTRIELEKGEVKLFLADNIQELMGDAVRKRLDGLGEALKAFSSSSK
jgi:exopolyphosphatase/guanosine-5'-triphosphate,3'-diphosphate pyrophosphatase